MSNKIQLSENLYLGEGRQKKVYQHPSDPEVCVKISKESESRDAKALKREIYYLNKHQSNIPFVSKYLGEVHTNYGKAFMFELIRDFDGQVSKPLDEMLSIIEEPAEFSKRIADLFHSLLQYRAALTELEPCNILVRKLSNTTFDLVIIDGFGNSDFIKICDISRFFLRKKLVRKFRGLCKLLNIPSNFLD